MENITENNKLLAEFLGWKKPIIGNGLSRGYDYELPSSIELYGENELHYCSDCGNDLHLLDGCYKEDLKFHNDWNWLMLVVDKIENLTIDDTDCAGVEIYTHHVEIKVFSGRVENQKTFLTHIPRHYPTKLEATYNACIEFVKWYNENKNKRLTQGIE